MPGPPFPVPTVPKLIVGVVPPLEMSGPEEKTPGVTELGVSARLLAGLGGDWPLGFTVMTFSCKSWVTPTLPPALVVPT